MSELPDKDIKQPVSFGPYRILGSTGPLICGSQDVQLRATPLKMLWYLATRPGRVISKDELFKAIWPDRIIGENNLTVSVREIREALQDDVRSPLYLQTVHRVGYRFIGRSAKAVAVRSALFVGRQSQLSGLHAELTSTVAGNCRLIQVSAHPGHGKSALIDTWISQLNESTRVLRGHCIDKTAASDAYSPFVSAFREMSRGSERVLLVRHMRRVAPTWLLQFPTLTSERERTELQHGAAAADASQMRHELADLLTCLAQDKPLILALDDMHWCDAASATSLTHLVDELPEVRLLIVVSCRSTELLQHGHTLSKTLGKLKLQDHCSEIQLPPLSRDEVTRFLHQRFGDRCSDTLVEAIYSHSQGHPLFMAALADHLAGTVETVKLNSSEPLKLPESLLTYIDLQMADVSTVEKHLLEAASVAGELFAVDDIKSASVDADSQPVPLEQMCESLARRGEFLVEQGSVKRPDGSVSGTFRFHHALYPELIQRRISSNRLIRLHQRIAESVEQAYADDLSGVATKLAHHFEHSGNLLRAAHYLKMAAAVATQRFAHNEAADILRRALQLTVDNPDSDARATQELELLLALAPVLIALHGYSSTEVGGILSTARELCNKPTLAHFKFPVLRGLAAFHHLKANYQTAFELGREVIAIDPDGHSPQSGMLVEGHMMCGIIDFFRGNFNATATSLAQSIVHYNAELHGEHRLVHGVDPLILATSFDALNSWILGDETRAVTQAHSAQHGAEKIDHPFTMAQCHAMLALLHQIRGDLKETEKYSTSAAALAEQYGFPYLAASETARSGWLKVQHHGAGASVSLIEQGLSHYRKTGAAGGLSVVMATLAEACLLSNALEAGLQTVNNALAMSKKTNEGLFRAELMRLHGELLFATGDDANLAMVERCFQQSLALANEQNARAWQVRTTLSLAALWHLNENQQAAADLLEPVKHQVPTFAVGAQFVRQWETLAISDRNAAARINV